MEIRIPQDANYGSKEELESLKSEMIENEMLPEDQQWITHKSIPEETQLELLRSLKQGDTETFNEKYTELRNDKLLDFGFEALDALGNASLLLGGAGLIGKGATALGKKLFSSSISSGLKETAKVGASKISNVFSKSVPSNIKEAYTVGKEVKAGESLVGAGETFAENQAIRAGQTVSRIKRSNPFRQSDLAIEGELVAGGGAQKISNIFRKNKSKDKLSTNNKPNRLFESPIRQLMGGLMGGLFSGSGSQQGFGAGSSGVGGGSLRPSGNSVEAELNSMPSGGDSGITGESFFGDGGISGKTVSEILLKIYSILTSANQKLSEISKNTGQMSKVSAQQDTARDLASSNIKARENEQNNSSGEEILSKPASERELDRDQDEENIVKWMVRKKGIKAAKQLAGILGLGYLLEGEAGESDADSSKTGSNNSKTASPMNLGDVDTTSPIIDTVVSDPSKSTKEHYEKVYKLALAEAQARGYKNPEVQAQLAASQSVLETGSGKHVPAENALFGIKYTKPGQGTSEPSGLVSTPEVENGNNVISKAQFRGYSSEEDAIKDRFDFLEQNQRYSNVLSAENPKQIAEEIGKSGYATDPNYGQKVYNIMSQNTMNYGPTKENAAKLQPSASSIIPNTVTQSTKEIIPVDNVILDAANRAYSSLFTDKTQPPDLSNQTNLTYIEKPVRETVDYQQKPKSQAKNIVTKTAEPIVSPAPNNESEYNSYAIQDTQSNPTFVLEDIREKISSGTNANFVQPQQQVQQSQPSIAQTQPDPGLGGGVSVPPVRNDDPTLKRMEEGNIWSTNSSNS